MSTLNLEERQLAFLLYDELDEEDLILLQTHRMNRKKAAEVLGKERVRTVWSFPRSGRFWEEELQTWPDVMFVKRLRVTRNIFDRLLTALQSMIRRQETHLRLTIPADKRLAVFLRFVAAGGTLVDVADRFGVGYSTTIEIISDCARACIACLPRPKLPEESEEMDLSSKSYRFPGTIGTVDGTHIPILRPKGQHFDQYFNYKHFFSMILLTVFGPNREIIFYDCSYGGRCSDGGVFECCGLKQIVETFPSKYHLLGDSGFPLMPGLLKPYSVSSAESDPVKRHFNFRLSSDRMQAEQGFGDMKNRMRCLKTPLPFYDMDRITDVISACVLLHNFWVANVTEEEEARLFFSSLMDTDYVSEDSDSEDDDETTAPSYVTGRIDTRAERKREDIAADLFLGI